MPRQSSIELKMPPDARQHMQPQSLFAVRDGMQGCIQNVLGCAFDTPHPQTQENSQIVSISLSRPLTHLKKTIIGFIKSLLFAGGYSALVRRSICFLT